MGIFDWVMHGLGFETTEKKQKKGKTITAEQSEDKYANFNLHEKVEGSETKQEPAKTNFGGFNMQPETNIIILEPKTQTDIQKVVDYLKQGQSVGVNLAGISADDSSRILDFLSGSIYALNGSIMRWHGDLFLLTPEGHKILRSDK
ncbi:MAG: cell division protein SepF [Clostridiales bacterium]|nr:cell division protein SepF [Clostridiales bacterium]